MKQCQRVLVKAVPFKTGHFAYKINGLGKYLMPKKFFKYQGKVYAFGSILQGTQFVDNCAELQIISTNKFINLSSLKRKVVYVFGQQVNQRVKLCRSVF